MTANKANAIALQETLDGANFTPAEFRERIANLLGVVNGEPRKVFRKPTEPTRKGVK